MTTLITYSDSSGSRRCDAKCYGAKVGSECTCCCGGMNHAVGHQQALDNTREHAADLCERYGDNALAETIRQLPMAVAA